MYSTDSCRELLLYLQVGTRCHLVQTPEADHAFALNFPDGRIGIRSCLILTLPSKINSVNCCGNLPALQQPNASSASRSVTFLPRRLDTGFGTRLICRAAKSLPGSYIRMACTIRLVTKRRNASTFENRHALGQPAIIPVQQVPSEHGNVSGTKFCQCHHGGRVRTFNAAAPKPIDFLSQQPLLW